MSIRQAFGSPSGKSVLAPRITKLIPQHTTYVEPFAGGAAVFYYKEPSQKEILNDKDAEIAFMHRFIRDMTSEQIKQLKRYDWHRRETLFRRLKSSQPKTPIEKFRRLYYITIASFANGRETYGFGQTSKIDVDKLLKCKGRLRNVTILSMDGITAIRKYDRPGTFFYIDPPYPGRDFVGKGAQGFDEKSLQKLIDCLKGIRGKFILSLGAEHTKLLPRSWHIKRVKVRRNMVDPRTGKPIPANMEILVANFKI
jgi:DNA adenine methylase